jgi:hypothetical protein
VAHGPPNLLDVGDRAGGGGADLDQCLFHLEDDHPDHPRRVFRPVEKLGHVRREDVASAAEHRTAEPAGDRREPRRQALLGSLGLPDQHWRADRDLGFEDLEVRH